MADSITSEHSQLTFSPEHSVSFIIVKKTQYFVYNPCHCELIILVSKNRFLLLICLAKWLQKHVTEQVHPAPPLSCSHSLLPSLISLSPSKVSSVCSSLNYKVHSMLLSVIMKIPASGQRSDLLRGERIRATRQGPIPEPGSQSWWPQGSVICHKLQSVSLWQNSLSSKMPR